MTPVVVAPPDQARRTVADLLESLGGVGPERVLLLSLGTATEVDMERLVDGIDRVPCELIDGTLVVKPVGFPEALVTTTVSSSLVGYVHEHNLGCVTGPRGPFRLRSGLTRMPSVGFTSWSRIPGGRMPNTFALHGAPDLAVEILRPSNTAGEMRLKRRHFFEAGTLLIWEIDAGSRSVTVYTRPDAPNATLSSGQTLHGGRALPGFMLAVADVFEVLDRHAPD